jgi:hypothetical protein
VALVVYINWHFFKLSRGENIMSNSKKMDTASIYDTLYIKNTHKRMSKQVDNIGRANPYDASQPRNIAATSKTNPPTR